MLPFGMIGFTFARLWSGGGDRPGAHLRVTNTLMSRPTLDARIRIPLCGGRRPTRSLRGNSVAPTTADLVRWGHDLHGTA
jgi:hypothetical protein